MGTLNKRFQYVWYGDCSEQENCKPYVFSENPTALTVSVEMISTFTTDNSNNSIKYYKPETDEGDLDRMNCGAMYCIVLKSGKSISIPGAVPAGSDTIKQGENTFPAAISFTCSDVYEATPTPSEFKCSPDGFTSVEVTSNNQQVLINNTFQKFVTFQNGDSIGIDMSYFDADIASFITVKIPATGFQAAIILTGLKPKAEGGTLYLQRSTACYAGPYKLVDEEWEVHLVLVSGQEPTPTPVPVPTPTPDEVDCTCAPSSYVTLTSTSPSPFVSGGHTFGGFAAGTEISYDASTLEIDAAAAVTLNFPNGTSAGTVFFTGKKPNGTQFYIRHGATCYTATATSSNVGSSGWTLAMVVSRTLSSECGQAQPVPTPTPVQDTTPPTATISGAPTSAIYPDTDIELTIGGTDVTHYKYWLTPDYENSSGQMGIVAKILKGPNDWTLGTHTVKVVGRDAAGNWQTEANATTVTFQVIAETPSECCPSTHTTFTVNGSYDETSYNYTNENDKTSLHLGWQGFENGGKLCVDVTRSTGWGENDSEPPKLVYYNSATGNPVAQMRKVLQNGDRNTIYYTDANGKCWSGDYNENPIILT